VARDIWTLLSSKVQSAAGGGIWQQVSAIEPLPFIPSECNMWSILGNCPGGMWQELGNETIILRGRKCRDIWEEVNEETLIIRPRRNLWGELARAPLSQVGGGGVWAEASSRTLRLARPRQTVWSMATQAGNFIQYKPVRRLGWALKKLETIGGEPYYILKNLRAGLYLRLSEEQVFLWNLMDGQHSVQDMAVAYFITYKSLAIQGLLVLLGQLEAQGFLVEQHIDVYANTAAALGRERGKSLAGRLARAFTQTTFSIRGIDGLLTRLYRGGVFLIFKRPVQMLMLVITLAGFGAFIYQMQAGGYSVITGGGEYLAVGLTALYVAQFLAIFLHESSHAFTCKHYGREVRRAGFMIYLGMPAFFVDTTDIWMEPRRPRLLVSWAGPYSGFFLAAVASLLMLVIHSPFIGGLLYQFAFTCNLLSIMNLNPLLQWDGYYILMDWLEIPMLRARAQGFVQRELWHKLRQRVKFTREEKIFTAYGILSIVYTALIVFYVLKALGGTILDFLQRIFGPEAALIITLALAVGLVALLVWPFVRVLIGKRQAAVVAR
jgi:putative peptide zinc metalloprotease protein